MEEVGKLIKAAREARGLSIEDLYAKTRIRPRTITAIESGEFHSVSGGAVYVRGFVRTLCDELGIDCKHVAFPTPSPTTARGVTSKRSRILPWRRWLGVLLVMSAVLWLSLYHGYWPSRPVPPPPVVTAPIVPVAPIEPVTPTLPEPPPSPAWVLRQGEGNNTVFEVLQWPLELTVKVHAEQCWMAVTSDGGRTTSMMLSAGNAMTFKANETLNLRLGRARVVEILVNGNALPQQSGDVRDLEFVRPLHGR